MFGRYTVFSFDQCFSPYTVGSTKQSAVGTGKVRTTEASNSTAIVVTYPNSQSPQTIGKYTAISILSRYTG